MNPDTLERLQDHLKPDNAPPGQEREAWRVRTQDDAAWASRKARDAHWEIKAIDDWEEREIARVREAAANERKQHENTKEFFESALGTYLLELARDGRAKKSLALPGGTIKLRARQPDVLLDDNKAISWLKEHGHSEFVRVKESPDKAALKKALVHEPGVGVILTSTGEVVDWAEIEEQPDSVSFAPAEDES